MEIQLFNLQVTILVVGKITCSVQFQSVAAQNVELICSVRFSDYFLSKRKHTMLLGLTLQTNIHIKFMLNAAPRFSVSHGSGSVETFVLATI